MKKFFLTAFCILALICFVKSRPTVKTSVTQQASVEPKEAPAKTLKPHWKKLAIAAKKTAPTQPAANAVARVDVTSALRKFTTSGVWHTQYDPSGRPAKMTGGIMKGVMGEGPEAAELLKDVQASMGFKKSAIFSRTENNQGSMKVVDQTEMAQLPDGRVLPVYGGSLRLMGDANGNAFLVQNNLHSVDNVAASTLDDRGALAAAETHMRSLGADSRTTYSIAPTQAHTVYAQTSPQQEVIMVVAKTADEDRVLLVSAASGAIIRDWIDGVE